MSRIIVISNTHNAKPPISTASQLLFVAVAPMQYEPGANCDANMPV